MWNKHHTQTKTETDIRTELFWPFSAQKWHWKYCSRIPLEYWPSRGLWMSQAVSRVHYSDSWRLHKCTDLCRQMHKSVSMSCVKICVDVTICKTSWSCQVTKWSHTFRVHLEWASNIRRRIESESTHIFWCVTYQRSMDTGGFQNYAWAIDPFKGPFIHYVIQNLGSQPRDPSPCVIL